MTVDRQMRRYKVPRVAFINKCDRTGANPVRVKNQLREILGHNPVLMQLPIGLEIKHEGIVDLVEMKALRFNGENGEEIVLERVQISQPVKSAVSEENICSRKASRSSTSSSIFPLSGKVCSLSA